MNRVAIALAVIVSSHGWAAEPWADPGLSVHKGLLLWIDAARQPAAWKAHARPPLMNGALLDVAYDASGNKLHLVQRVAAAQPRFISGKEAALFRFDGKDDFLGATGLDRKLESLTLFILAVPRTNAGGFQGFLACHETGKNDYSTGLTVDMAFASTPTLSQVNVEGKGFGGAVNLMKKPQPFGKPVLIEVQCQPGAGGVKLFVDGVLQGQRKRDKGMLSLEGLCLAARCYSNSADPPFVQGFLDGDVAEVLLYDRVLDDKELAEVRGRLQKQARMLDGLAAGRIGGGHLLTPVADPPLVQMLVPGFSVRELPLDLTNINNLRYRADGKLVALGYNGNIWLLSDTDGDGLEDKAQLFWENKVGMLGPLGIALTPPKYDKGQGVFVASKGKVSLIVDTDGDDKADEEIIVAKGWEIIAQAVDALGVALDKDNNLYFGLGCANFANAYLKEKDGKARYDIKSDRGTIQKVSADFKKRETVCTGIRFPVGLAFNRHGDLFCTDQEGATWLPNGNPLDELLHILPGRHYGFPPRHPKILPDVIDEPSVYDYGPQHQSTCGLCFNESVNGGPVFGPESWAGDAIVCGESRGKLYRTKLVKTPHGYVAQNHIIACLQMLTVDACVSPKGDLVLACHTGPPDWGTGPAGKGKLFKICYTDKKAPQPVLAWAQGPREVRIAFDKPLEVEHLSDLTAKKVKIEYGKYVQPGDRFETLKPPYAIVQMHWATPRHYLDVHSVQVTPDRRTVILQTAAFPEAVNYAVTLPWPKAAKRDVGQHATIDVGFDLSGVAGAFEGQEIVLPHLDLDVSGTLTKESAEHQRFWNLHKEKVGVLKLETTLDAGNLLRPVIQEGADIDHKWPGEKITVTLDANGLALVATPTGKTHKVHHTPSSKRFSFSLTNDEPKRHALRLELITEPASLSASFHTDEDKRERALPLRRFILPFAPERNRDPAVAAKRDILQLKGGNWLHGKELFFSFKSQCSACHTYQGAGGKIGPDLSNLSQRDYDSVMRDIRTPSAAINPDHLAFTLAIDDGRFLSGTIRSKDADTLIVGTPEGKEIIVERKSVEEMRPLKTSIMPEGIDKKLSDEELRDLLTYLMTEPLLPAVIPNPGAPPPRSKKEFEAFLKREPAKEKPRTLNIVLSSSKQDHGPGEHDYPLWQRRWMTLLSMAENVQVHTATGWPSARQWEVADVIVFNSSNPGWGADKAKVLDDYLARGGGLVYLHFGVNGHKAPNELAERIGLAWGPKAKYRHGPVNLTFDDGEHPISKGFSKVRFVDESYWNLTGDPKRIHVLASATEEKSSRPLLWTREVGKGRTFVSILGHYTWTFDDPLFRILVLRGIAWTAGESPDRLLDLVTVGARME